MYETLKKRLEGLLDRYETIRKELGNELAARFKEELNTTLQVEVVTALLDTLGLGDRCSIHDWVEMNNSLAMTGTLYERAETEVAPEIDALLHQYLEDKMTEDACVERAQFLAMQAGVKDMDGFMKKFKAKLTFVKKGLRQ